VLQLESTSSSGGAQHPYQVLSAVMGSLVQYEPAAAARSFGSKGSIVTDEEQHVCTCHYEAGFIAWQEIVLNSKRWLCIDAQECVPFASSEASECPAKPAARPAKPS
jgi:hypothetical protein